MSYAIAQVCYGIPLNESTTSIIDQYNGEESSENDLAEDFNEDEEELDELDYWKYGTTKSKSDEEYFDVNEYFKTFYSGSAGHTPGVCGIKLSSFDECSDMNVSEMMELLKPPTEDQIKEALAKIAELPEDLRKLLPEPSHFIIWSTS